MDPRVFETMKPYFLELYGNAASKSHSFGWQAEEAVDYSREQVAKIIGANTKEVIFTSGATESNNLAIKGVYEMYAAKGNHFITVSTEHKAVLDACKHLEKLGAEVTYLPVGMDGLIQVSQIEAALKPTTVLVSVMYAINELGVIQPIRQIGELCRKNGVLFHTDATQAVGKIPVDVNADFIDLLSFTGHKMYGPKGIALLYVREGIKIEPILHGGGQENGIRPGTENLPSIVGFAEALGIVLHKKEKEHAQGVMLFNAGWA
jgi:cysteine desulfurase